MASAPPLPFVSVEEYLRTSYEPECEYIDGVLVPKEMPRNKHSLLQMLVIVQLLARARELDLSVRPELRIRTAPMRFRVPDVCVYEGGLRDEVPSHAPLVTVEVASDTEPMLSLRSKLRDHLAMGARLAVIVDPYDRSVFVQDENGLRSVEGPLVVRVECRKGVLEVDFDALFSQMDSELER